jgi:hypothetical protein
MSVVFQPVSSLIFASVSAMWRLPVLSTTAQNDEEMQSAAFIAPDPISSSANHSSEAGRLV